MDKNKEKCLYNMEEAQKMFQAFARNCFTVDENFWIKIIIVFFKKLFKALQGTQYNEKS